MRPSIHEGLLRIQSVAVNLITGLWVSSSFLVHQRDGPLSSEPSIQRPIVLGMNIAGVSFHSTEACSHTQKTVVHLYSP